MRAFAGKYRLVFIVLILWTLLLLVLEKGSYSRLVSVGFFCLLFSIFQILSARLLFSLAFVNALLSALMLGSGLIDQIQKITVAAMQIADMKVCAHRS